MANEGLQITDSQAKQEEIFGERKERIEEVKTWFNEASEWIAPLHLKWCSNEKLYKNQIDSNLINATTKIKADIALSIVESIMGKIKDYLPDSDVIGVDENDQPHANMMQKRKKHVERRAKLKKAILNAIKDSEKLGIGIIDIQPNYRKIRYVVDEKGNYEGTDEFNNESKIRELTDEVYDSRSPIRANAADIFTIYPNAGATGLQLGKECRYFIVVQIEHIDEAYRILKKYLKKPLEAEGYLTSDNKFHDLTSKNLSKNDKARANCVQIFRCYSMDIDDETYPIGRDTCWVNDTVLWDKPLERHPGYFMIKNYGNEYEYAGLAEAEIIKEIILAINEILSAIADNIKYTGNPRQKILQTLWTRLKGKIPVKPGAKIQVLNMNEIDWENPPNIPAYIFKYLELVLRLIEIITGVTDVVRGMKPASVQAGIAIKTLEEAAETRIRGKLEDEIAEFIISIGEYIVGILQQYDRETINIREEIQLGRYEFTEYNPSARLDKNGKTDVEEGFDGESAQTIGDSKFEIEIVKGLRLPEGRIETAQLALEKWEKGIYGPEEYYRHEPDGAKKLENYYKRQDMQQIKAEVEAFSEAAGEFSKLIQQLYKISEQEEIEKSDNLKLDEIENRMGDLLEAFPKLLKVNGLFDVLPEKLKDKLLSVFVKPAEVEV